MYKLLIVDDEEDIRRGLAEFFPWEEIGYQVVGTAPNGRQALEQVRHGEVDVVFCDIRMPVLSGMELARVIAEEHRSVAVVFLSAYKDFSYARQALKYGVRDYVLKPTNFPDIRAVFRRLKKEMDCELPAVLEASGAPKDRSTVSGSRQRADWVISAIKGYVERDYPRATLKGAARIVQMNPQYVSRLFKEKTGENFNTFLKRTKMTKAAQLLQEVDYLVYDVSEMVGYSNPKNFTRLFKKYFGITPHQYRSRPL
jgi:two-component system response regulator YesN